MEATTKMEKLLNLKDVDAELKNASEEALTRWRSAFFIVKNRRRRSRMVAVLAKRSETEMKKLHIQEQEQPPELEREQGPELEREQPPELEREQPPELEREMVPAPRLEREQALELERDPKLEREQELAQAAREQDLELEQELAPAARLEREQPQELEREMAPAARDLELEREQAPTARHEDRERLKVDLEWIFVIVNFLLELSSAVFDQLSSVHKPQFALLSMLMSFIVLLMCIVELVYKCRKEKVIWKWRGTLPWFYLLRSHKPFGSFKDIIALMCAICQCVVTTIIYNFCLRHVDNPIKISVWPIIFAFGLLCSKFLGDGQRRSTSLSRDVTL